MSRRRATPLVVAVLGVAALVAVVAAWAAQQPAVQREGHAAIHPSCPAPSPGFHRVGVEQDRVPVLLYVPHQPATALRRLVLVLPGAGMTGLDMAKYTGYARLAERKNFLVAFPTASGDRPFWNVSGSQPGKPDDVAYLRHVVTTLTSTVCADPARVGVTGVSNGGGMSALMACRAADVLAAAAPVAGGYKTLPDCEPARPLPLLEIHGMRDGVVPYFGEKTTGAGNVDDYINDWRARDNCAPRARRSKPAPNIDELRWTCAAGRIVVHDRVIDGAHGWPGGSSLKPFSTTLRTWRFLSAFRDDQQG